MELQKAIPLFQVSFLKGFMLMYPGLRVRRADYLLYLIVMHSNLRGIEHQTNDDIIAIMQRIVATSAV